MSLRTRLILSYTLIIVLCLGTAGLAAGALFQTYRDRTIMAQLDAMTRPIQVQVRALLRGQATAADVWANMQEQAQKNRVYILFVDDKGDITRQASPEENPKQPLAVSEPLPHGITQPAHGTFATTAGQAFVYAAYPVGRAADLKAVAPDTLVLATPRTRAVLVLAGLAIPFLWAGLIALGISVVMAFFLARSVYRPVQDLARAAESIAQGKYDQLVPVTGPREIRGLAVSFNEMRDKVRESQHQLRHFVADVSHQLKSPLTSIQGFAEAMLDGTAGDKKTRTKAAQIIADESKRMLRQVNQLLELSRMQSGQVKMVREPVDINELLLRCREIFALRAQEKGISLKTEADVLPTVTGDPDRLEDVFCNLLDNAVKNTPARGEVTVSAGTEALGSVRVSVADSGPGIPPEQLPHVFNRFQESSGLRTGFGLGLAIAREIVLAHAGTIQVISEPGEGARFIVTLPAGAPAPPPAA